MARLLKTHPSGERSEPWSKTSIVLGFVSLLIAGWALAQPVPSVPTTTTTENQ